MDEKPPSKESAFVRLYQLGRSRLIRNARAKGCRQESAEQVTASAFRVVWTHMSDLISRPAGRGMLPAWLFGIQKNKLFEHFRRKKKIGQPLVADIGVESNPSEHAIQMENLEALKAALPYLNKDDLEIVRLFYIEGLKPKEVGSRLGMTAEAAQMRRRRATGRLGAIIKEKKIEPEVR